ncbi:hypothetical protein HanRHA438_Chr06g0276501 [Helianthus annuus]|nr:hypothetical protein HanRHA438_Chr06g0276501 [Helianthus annuus]
MEYEALVESTETVTVASRRVVVRCVEQKGLLVLKMRWWWAENERRRWSVKMKTVMDEGGSTAASLPRLLEKSTEDNFAWRVVKMCNVLGLTAKLVDVGDNLFLESVSTLFLKKKICFYSFYFFFLIKMPVGLKPPE